MTKDEARNTIEKLVKSFETNIIQLNNSKLDEHTTRIQYIDKFFYALGWDINNDELLPLDKRFVVQEAKQKVAGQNKHPDYSFCYPGGKNLFYLEAKKPSVNVYADINAAFQVKSYGWSAQLPISVLTDFEEFAIYNTKTHEPHYLEAADEGRLEYFRYNEYLNKFDFLWDMFAFENVKKKSIDKYYEAKVGKTKRQKGITVDEAFLRDIENWRSVLAANIILRNKTIRNNKNEINFVVQKIIDRIIFLRIAEDRGTEHYGTMENILKEKYIYNELLQICYNADQKYNSGLFHFRKENDNDNSVDEITPKLKIDNQIFIDIIAPLYGSRCQYQFDVMPADILGSVYERFLGKEIVNSNIVEKIEIRKAGGVYYTPQYIVDYIVNNTLGEVLKNKTSEQIKNIKICDPASGSGSFLLVAYQKLLDFYLNCYLENRTKYKNFITTAGQLTISERKRILLDHIFGVDIDEQAVEVTKLSLLLKAMEGVSDEQIQIQNAIFHERVLPNLSNNIKCGNSLIDDPKIAGEKAFCWKKEFPTVFEKNENTKNKNYGFDIVIGNPPYGAELTKDAQNYCNKHYNIGSTDTAALFIIQADKLLNENGTNGFIIPKSFTFASNWAKVREYVLSKLTDIVDCSKVWKDVKLEQSIIITQKNSNKITFNTYCRQNMNIESLGSIDKKLCNEFGFILNGVSQQEINIAIKIKRNNGVLNDIIQNNRGSTIYSRFILDKGNYAVVGGKQISRYSIHSTKGFVENKNLISDKGKIQQDSIIVQNIITYVLKPKETIRIVACIPDNFDCFINDTINQLTITDKKIDKKIIWALLNCKLTNWYAFNFIYVKAIMTMHFDNPTTSRIPFPSNVDKRIYNKIIALVDEIFADKKNNKDTTALEAKIDKLVYELYDLTDEEIKYIEGKD
jgi:hypothetical protein